MTNFLYLCRNDIIDMESQILKLERPYEYISCNGSIGLHIATMITYEATTDEDGNYRLQTHSHPVVKYPNRPGGTVWNRAELTDCKVLCSEDKRSITMEQFYDFVSDSRFLNLDEDGKENGISTSSDPVIWNHVLGRYGIEVEWPTVSEDDGSRAPQTEFEVGLRIRRNPEGSPTIYTCHDMGVDDDTAYRGGAGLYFYFDFDTEADLEVRLLLGIRSYYRAFSNHQFHITFLWEEDSEFAEVIDRVNRQEAEMRPKRNDLNV